MSGDTQESSPQGWDVNVEDFVHQINADDVKTATLILDIPHALYMAALSEASFKAVGCRYTSQNPTDISNILDILKSANIKPKSSIGPSLELGEGIYFTLADGKEIKFLLASPYQGQETISGRFNKDPITANSSLPESLYRWATQFEVNPRCEGFLSKYRNK